MIVLPEAAENESLRSLTLIPSLLSYGVPRATSLARSFSSFAAIASQSTLTYYDMITRY
jgi:hypothetical protein